MDIRAHKLIVAANKAGIDIEDFVLDIDDSGIDLAAGVFSAKELRFIADWLDQNLEKK